MKKYVKCMDNDAGGATLQLTVGKVYELISEDPIRKYCEVLNENGCSVLYQSKRFKIVDCPCGINDCMTHRKSL